MAIVLAYIESHKNEHIDALCNDYLKKLQGIFTTKTWVIPSSKVSLPEQQQLIESEALKKKVKPQDTLILCDERGKSFSSPKFSEFIQLKMNYSRGDLIFAIGGAYGFSEELRQQCECIKLSEFVFPHQIARLVLTEQIYRAYQISKNTGYHHI